MSSPVRYDATPFLPERLSLTAMRAAVQGCRGCPLFRNATQAVFGEGRKGARLLIIGEQPGDQEDLSGRPFVGPSGRVLDDALATAGLSRADAYVTNAVKHFKWVAAEDRRLHKKPTAREVTACRPWLEGEIATIKPAVVLCLGATAAQALLGRAFRVTTQRGRLLPSPLAARTIATIHPSAILRQRSSEERRLAMNAFVTDLKAVTRALRAVS